MNDAMKLSLEIGRPVFHIGFSLKDRAIILTWCADTNAANVVWMRLVVIKLAFPPVRIVECFTDR